MDDFLNWINVGITHDWIRSVVVAAIIIAITAVLAHLSTKVLRRILNHDGNSLPTSSITINVARITIWAIGIAFMLSHCFNVDVNGLIAALGVGGIALSLGFQDTLKNFIGGVQITTMNIVQPGDHIIVGGAEGIVHDVTWRQTVMKDYENKVHIIPNAVISSTEVVKVLPEHLVSTVVVLNNDGRDVDAMLREMELLAKEAVEKVAPLEKDPWLLVTQIGEYGIWTTMRFVLADITNAREARDAAMRAIAPYTRNSSDQMLVDNGEHAVQHASSPRISKTDPVSSGLERDDSGSRV